MDWCVCIYYHYLFAYLPPITPSNIHLKSLRRLKMIFFLQLDSDNTIYLMKTVQMPLCILNLIRKKPL